MKRVSKTQKKLKRNKKKFSVEKKETPDLQLDNILESSELTEKPEAPEIIEHEEIPKKKKIKGRAEHRTEPSQNISEFNLTEVGKEKVKLDELVRASQKISGQASVKKQLQKAKKLKRLSVPLSRPQLEKIKRTVAYDKVCNEVAKWDKVVKSNRDADQIVYPLKRPEFHLESFKSTSERYVSKHPVEEAVYKVLQNSENVLDDTRITTEAEEKALQAMSVEQAKYRHSELMKHKALLSYKEAKVRRQNKIKSKRYHRILKREKLKQMVKEFEELQKTDEMAALEKFLETDKLRILERMTLKHRNTGKWAKQQKIRAKYNPESRSSLKEDLQIGRQLKEKISKLSLQTEKNIEKNPDTFFEDSSEKYLREEYENLSTEETVADIHVSTSQTVEVSQNLTTSEAEKNGSKTEQYSKPNFVEASNNKSEMIFTSEATYINSEIPDNITCGDDLDDLEDVKMSMNEAFADTDVIADFQKEKKIAERANKVQGINTFLPGWGSWGGPAIKFSKKKKRRFFIKPLEQQPKKDTLGNVILNEDKDKKAAVHQVSHLPFPFSNVNQFESCIRQPIGHTWNPQSAFQNMIASKTITKMGKIIDPIDSEDVLLENKNQELKR